MKKKEILYKITFEDLVGFLKQNYPNGALIKIYSKKENTIYFYNKNVVLGTLHYYRTLEDTKDGRTDKLESITNPKVIGVGGFSDGTTFVIQRSDGLTSLCFCMFHFDPKNKETISNLKKSIDELGSYICVVDYCDRDRLHWLFTRAKYKGVVKGNLKIVSDFYLEGDNKEIKYVDDPDYSGFKKRKEFKWQQEYRYIFSLDKIRGKHKNIDVTSALVLFSLTKDIEIYPFEII